MCTSQDFGQLCVLRVFDDRSVAGALKVKDAHSRTKDLGENDNESLARFNPDTLVRLLSPASDCQDRGSMLIPPLRTADTG